VPLTPECFHLISFFFLYLSTFTLNTIDIGVAYSPIGIIPIPNQPAEIPREIPGIFLSNEND